MKLRTLVITFLTIFWPIGLFVHNQNQELLTFIAPTILLALVYKYYRCSWYYLVPLLLIPFVSPKLTLFPIIFIILNLLTADHGPRIAVTKLKLFSLLISIVIAVFSWSDFSGQTIFTPDYEAGQAVIRKQQLYPTPLTARIFANKGRIIIDKANDNLFALIDPNNYFFGFAPRQIVSNQNLQKFPFLSLPFLLFGFYYITKSKEKRFIMVSLFTASLSLIPLSLFDKNDFILYLPILFTMIHGMKMMEGKFNKGATYYYLFVIVFSIIELTRTLL